MKVDVLIVGGGIAGLTSAAYLTKNGYDVLLCEKQPKVGGLIGSYEKNGFTFDQGIRAFENSGILFPMLKSFDISLDLMPNPVKIGLKDDFVDVSDDNFLKNYQNLLIKYFPSEEQNINNIINKIELVMKHFEILYEIDNPILLEGKIKSDYLFKTLLPWLFKYTKSMKKSKEFYVPVDEYLRKFTENQELIDIIIQHFFEKTPAFFALSYFGFYREYKYPAGGTKALIDEMSAYLEKKGAKVFTDTKIETVDLKNKTATTFQGQKIFFKKIIWAADQKTLYHNIVELPNKKSKQKKLLVSKSRGSESVFSVNLGVKLEGAYFKEKIGPHCFYTAFTKGISHLGKWQDSSNLDEWLKDFLKYTTYEISCPSLRDSSMAPKGHTNLIVSTLFDYDLVLHYKNKQDLNKLENIVKNEVLNLLSKTILPEIKNDIVFESCSSPLTIEKFTGNLDGSLTGWSYKNKIVPSTTNFKKITKSIQTELPNVYQAGQWTFSPAGMPTSILTGKLAADKIMKKVRKNK